MPPPISASFRSDLKKRIMQFVYEPTETSLAQQLQKIAEANSSLHNNRQPLFKHAGCLYGDFSDPIHREYHLVNKLEDPLIPQFEKYLIQMRDIETEQVYISSYLNSVLNSSEHIADYLAILPKCLHKIFGDADLLKTYGAPTLSTEKVQRINARNQKAVQFIKERLLWSIIV